MNPAADKANAMFVFGIIIIFFKILTVGPHVHVENGAVQIPAGVFLGNHGLLDGIHAADRRTIGIVTAVDVPGTDTLEPGDFLGFFVVRSPDQMPHGRPGGRKDPLHFDGCDHIGVVGIVIIVKRGRIERFKAGRQNNGADVQASLFRVAGHGFPG